MSHTAGLHAHLKHWTSLSCQDGVSDFQVGPRMMEGLAYSAVPNRVGVAKVFVGSEILLFGWALVHSSKTRNFCRCM